LLVSVLAAILAASATLCAGDKAPPHLAPADATRADVEKPRDALEEDARLLKMLGEPANVAKLFFAGFKDDKGLDRSTPIAFVLEEISRVKGVLVRVNYAAFEKLDPEFHYLETYMYRDVPALAPQLADVLADILSQMTPPATYIVKEGQIEVVPRQMLADGGLLKERVRREIVNMPFDEAVQRLASSTGASVVIDPRLGDKVKTPVSGMFRGVPLLTAVVAMADYVDVRVVPIENVLYVTSRENAMLNELELRRRGEPSR